MILSAPLLMLLPLLPAAVPLAQKSPPLRQAPVSAATVWRFEIRDSSLRAVAPGAKAVVLWDSTQNTTTSSASEDDEEEICSETSSAEPRSLAGTVATWFSRTSSYCSNIAHPSSSSRFATRDLVTGDEADLRRIFPPAALLAALSRDKVVLKAVGKVPQSLEQIEKGDGGCEIGFSPSMWRSFAFHHLQGDSVAVRIGLTHGCEAARGNFTQLGVLLPIPEAWKQPLLDAASRGLLMKNLTEKHRAN